MDDFTPLIKRLMRDPVQFAWRASGLRLRAYQEAVARAVVDSVVHRKGLSFVVMFPRQSGKNELQAQIEAYLLALFSQTPAEIVKVSPTWKPQSLNAMRRLERLLSRNLITCALPSGGSPGWKKESGYIFRVGEARIFFLSGAPEANIVGATASTLLEVDEAQDVLPDKFDKDIAPMAASTNATRVFWGTAWTSATLLARELRAAQAAEQRDGQRRLFVLGADDVAREVPAYGAFVAEAVARLGRNHPMVRTQFYSEEIDAAGGLFPPERCALMQGGHAPQDEPQPGRVYALLLDVGGEAANAQPATPDGPAREHDATVLTIVEVDLTSLADVGLRAPTYRVVQRRRWVGAAQPLIYAQVRALAERWAPRRIVVDATGIGAGLAAFLDKALPGRVLPFVFSAASKSKLGWDFLAVCDTGRFREALWEGLPGADLSAAFWREVRACAFSVTPGPEQHLRWGVPEGARDPQSGEPLHDDLLISAALCAVLDAQPWSPHGEPVLIRARDPLAERPRF